jgi:Zn-dependent protease/predicted transcriptional regulator
MGSSFRLGRIAGVEIGVNWSWLVIFVLITWTLAAGVFPRQNPDLSDGAHIAMAIAAAFLFFVSILLHELGHAVQARREGMEIEGITLWLFGGVARFAGMFPSAGAEFRIAVAGPVVTLVLGIACVSLAGAGLPEAAEGVAAWLGYTNFALLVFNLLPALPLDGGRMLRAALWSRMSFARATEVSGQIARAIAFGLIGLGLFMFLVAGAFGGAWLAFIGWFLLQASSAEVRSVLARQALDGLRVRDVMVSEPVTVEADMPLDRFIDEVVSRHRHTTYPVVENGRPVGLLPFRAVAEVPRSEWSTRTVRDCALPLERVPVVHERDQLADALAQLGEDGLNRGLVLENGRLAGLLSITDVLHALELRRLRAGRPLPTT